MSEIEFNLKELLPKKTYECLISQWPDNKMDFNDQFIEYEYKYLLFLTARREHCSNCGKNRDELPFTVKLLTYRTIHSMLRIANRPIIQSKRISTKDITFDYVCLECVIGGLEYGGEEVRKDIVRYVFPLLPLKVRALQTFLILKGAGKGAFRRR